jgi:hypothetical protein
MRFSALLLFAEKVLLVLFLLLLFELKVATSVIWGYVIVAAIFLMHTHANHFGLLEAAGMPVVRFILRF